MKIEKTFNIVLTNTEMTQAILTEIEIKMNNKVPGSREFNELEAIINQAKDSICSFDIDPAHNRFVLVIDGHQTEEI
jgi:hypothetical protein